MFRSILILLVLVASLQQCEPVEFTPEELQSIGNVLVEHYFKYHLIQKKVSVPRKILSGCVKFIFGFLQTLSVTASLIAANVFTPFFHFAPQTDMVTSPNVNVLHQQYKNSTIIPAKHCPHDYGCDRNVCWRSCRHINNGSKLESWCYTSPTPHYRKHAHCSSPFDCSPCWSCVGVCHMPTA